MANFYTDQATTSNRAPVIQYTPKLSVDGAAQEVHKDEPEQKFTITIPSSTAPLPSSQLLPTDKNTAKPPPLARTHSVDNIPPLVPISGNFYTQNVSDNLLIDEDYDN